MINLDSTAGNRVIWNCKTPPDWIFCDREIKLGLSPDVFCDNRYLPFRDNVFQCAIYDPPYQWGDKLWARDPKGKTEGGSKWSWYGTYKNKRDLIQNLIKASRELYRVSMRLCFKWCEFALPLSNIISLFIPPWIIFQQKGHNSKKQTSKNQTWWVTMVRTKTIICAEEEKKDEM